MQIQIRQSFFVLFFPLLLAGQEKVDLAVINRIKAEAFHHSTIMETAFYLTDVYGPRLTGSPALKEAADWSVKRMREFGQSNPRLESWGPFGRSWTNVNFCAHLRKPQYAPIIGMAKPWARSTEGPVSGQPVLAPMHAVADFAAYKGKLRGKIVMLEEPRILRPQSAPLMSRFSDAELAQRAESPEPGAFATPYDPTARVKFRNALNDFLNSEGVILTISPSFRLGRADPASFVEGGTIFSSYAGSRKIAEPLSPPSAAIAAEDYNRIARLLQHNIPVTVEFDIENKLSNEELDSFSVLAEIPGSSKADEIVMLGGHLDSMSFATGATDNAARRRGGDGSDANPQEARPQNAAHGPRRALDRRGTELRLAPLCRAALLRSGDEDGEAGAARGQRLFQSRYRNRKDSRLLSAGQRHDAADIRGLVRSLPRSGSDDGNDRQP